MVRTEAMKLAQKRYVEKNRTRVNCINRNSQIRCYKSRGKEYAKEFYNRNRNSRGIDNMSKSLRDMFEPELRKQKKNISKN